MLRTYEVQKKGDNVPSIETIREGTSILFSLQSMIVKYDRSNTKLWMLGVDPNGYSVAFSIRDFQPTFMVMVPQYFDDDDDDCEEDLEEFRQTHNKKLVMKAGCDAVSDVDIVRMCPFIGFTNKRQDRLIRIRCTSISVFSKVVEYFKETVPVYHADFEMPNQFMHQTGLAYQSWLKLDNVKFMTYSKATVCNVEGHVNMEGIKLFEGDPGIKTPPILKCFVRLKGVSRDGVVEGKELYHPDPKLVSDRILAISVIYVWSFQEDSKPVKEFVFTLFPKAGSLPDTIVERCKNEDELLQRFSTNILQYDPDDIIYYPDFIDTLSYIAQRSPQNGYNGGRSLYLERFKGDSCRVYSRGDSLNVKIESRSVQNLVAALKKKVFISVESYDLKTVSCNNSFRKKAETLDSFTIGDYDVNLLVKQGVDGRTKLLKALQNETRMVTYIERDTGSRLEFANISRVSDTDLGGTVSRGEQIRVYNKLSHFCMDNKTYMNKEHLQQKPLRFSIKKYPPTYKDPPEPVVTTKIREECLQYLEKKRSYHPPELLAKKKKVDPYKTSKNLKKDYFGTGEEHMDEEEEEEEVEGGNVMHPSPKFWEERVAVLDFASLYPSIMMAYNISYENVVFEEKYLNLPGVAYIFVPVNSQETVAIAQQPGIIPKLLEMLVENRRVIKKKMGSEQDPFRKSVYDKEQNSMKVLCNATYGFCGAEKKGSLLAMKDVMYIVTSLGRFLQKDAAAFMADKYGSPSVYGDTDSIFNTIELPWDSSIEELVLYASVKYKMDGYLKNLEGEKQSFTWANVCEHWKNIPKKKFDLVTLDKEHQINAAVYLIFEKLCEEVSTTFPNPVMLEFENMCLKTWMGWVKKHYMYQFWDPSDPTEFKKIKVTGMPSKKREYSPWTRNCLCKVSDFIENGLEQNIKPFLESEMEKLTSGKVPIENLTITKSYKGASKYKHFRQIHLQVVLKLNERHRWPVQENTRVYFVIVEGNEKLYFRSETPDFVKKNGMKMDYVYYMKNQFYTPMKKLLTYHPELFNFEQMFGRYLRILTSKNKGMADIKHPGTFSVKLTEEQALAKMRQNALMKNKRKTPPSSQMKANDPFSSFSAASKRKKI
jgi:DNA polymerase elongation subunit (family B)